MRTTLTNDWIYGAPEWAVYPLVIVTLLVFEEIGYHLGRAARSHGKESSHSQVVVLQTASLGLFALLVGFTFSMAENHFQARRSLVRTEANAISIAAMRATLLPEPQSREIEKLLERYVDARLQYQTAEELRVKSDRELANVKQHQIDMWRKVMAVNAQDSRSVPSQLFVIAFSEVVDIQRTRQLIARVRVPQLSLFLMFAVAAVGFGLTGYSCGLGHARDRVPNAIMAIIIAGAMILIVDLDRPKRGLITISEQPLADLRSELPAMYSAMQAPPIPTK